MSESPRYRPNVAAIVQDDKGRILVGERSDVPGAWQFPQGGMMEGERPTEALHRELQEEIMLAPDRYRIEEERGPYRYLFPTGRKKEGCDGQEQTYFRVRVEKETAEVLASQDPGEEFARLRWLEPSEFRLEWVAEMKRAVYQQVFRDFFDVNVI